jgi:hypothetical protein
MGPTVTRVRTALFGVLAGILLSASRAPLGIDGPQVPAAEAGTAAVFRAAALLAIALASGRTARLFAPRLAVSWLLGGTTLGFALHALLFDELWRPSVYGSLLLLVAAFAAALIVLADRAPAAEDAAPAPAADLAQRTGLFAAGAAAALALESVARVLRLFGGAQPADDGAFGTVFLAALAIGAMAFGPLLQPWRSGRRAQLAGGLALGTAACALSVFLLADISRRDALEAFLRHPLWDLDLSQVGLLAGDLLIGARALVAPAFVLGAALGALQHRSQLASLLVGAAAGTLLAPAFVAWTAVDRESSALLPALRVAIASLAAAAGAALALLGRPLPPRGAVAAGIALAAAAAIAGWFAPRAPAQPLSPWERFVVQPILVRDTAEGLLTIEPAREGGMVVTLDRRRLTPPAAFEAADLQRIELSWDQLPGDATSPRVLLIGQLTPLRARTLERLGASAIDRTAVWHLSMAELERHLFAGEPLPAGEILAPDQAMLRRYDLILAPPVEGWAPLVARVSAPGTVYVQWLRADGFPAHRDLRERVLLSSQGFDELCLGAGDVGAGALPAGREVAPPAAVRRLALRPFDRWRLGSRTSAERLARAAEGTPWQALARGLALHYEAQAPSSPFETPAEQVEISAEALALLREAALQETPGRFLRDLWEGIARILVLKREIEPIYEHLEPLAAAYPDWRPIQVALARADMEMLSPERAVARLEPLAQGDVRDPDLRLHLAQALIMAGEPRRAVEPLLDALALQPYRRELRRALAIALARAGDPAGQEMARELVRDDPGDADLAPYTGPGPYPDYQPSFQAPREP